MKMYLSLCLLSSLCIYASDDKSNSEKEAMLSSYVSILKAEVDEWNHGTIRANKFTQAGKAILQNHINVWDQAITEGNIERYKGLAAIWEKVKFDGVEFLINDKDALKTANEYLAEYEVSRSFRIEGIIKRELVPQPSGKYRFPGVEKFNADQIRITRQHELYNIMWLRHEAPGMPENLMPVYCDQTTTSAQTILKLNENNKGLKPAAIRGRMLVEAYLLQEDCKEQKS